MHMLFILREKLADIETPRSFTRNISPNTPYNGVSHAIPSRISVSASPFRIPALQTGILCAFEAEIVVRWPHSARGGAHRRAFDRNAPPASSGFSKPLGEAKKEPARFGLAEIRGNRSVRKIRALIRMVPPCVLEHGGGYLSPGMAIASRHARPSRWDRVDAMITARSISVL